MTKTIHASLGMLVWGIFATQTFAQDIEPKYKTPDTNSAVIHGRVLLPSGYTAEGYAKITLRNQQSILSIIYSNKSGEFQIRNLSEGTYFVQADVPNYEPVVRKLELGRGLMIDVMLELREKKTLDLPRSGPRIISAAELRQSVPAEAKKEYELGLKFVSKGNFQQAALHFTQALNIYPDYIAARNDLGAQYLKLKRIDEAEKNFQAVLVADQKNFNAKFNMGLVQIERHDYLGAIEYLNQAIAIDSTRPVARLWIGIAKLEQDNFAEAEAELTRSLVMGGNECAAAHYHLARIYMSRGDIEEARRSVESYLNEAPSGEFAKDAKLLEQAIAKKQK